MEYDNDNKVGIRNPVWTGFLLGLGVAAAFSLVAVVWLVVTAALARQAMDDAKEVAEVEKAYAAVQRQQDDATRQRAEEMVADEEAAQRAVYAEQSKASARQWAIDGLKVDVATLDAGGIFLSLRNTSPFAIKSARLRGIVSLQGREVARGDFDATFERRILQDQVGNIELSSTVLSKSKGDIVTDGDLAIEVLDITFGKQ